MVKTAMPYVDGTASVSFQIDSAGVVTAFRLSNDQAADLLDAETYYAELKARLDERSPA
jgi:hypothetical protein